MSETEHTEKTETVIAAPVTTDASQAKEQVEVTETKTVTESDHVEG